MRFTSPSTLSKSELRWSKHLDSWAIILACTFRDLIACNGIWCKSLPWWYFQYQESFNGMKFVEVVKYSIFSFLQLSFV